MNRQVLAVVVGAVLLSVAGVGLAGEAIPEQKGSTVKAQPSNAAGMRVYVDPESGDLVSAPVTAEQKAAAAADAEQFRQDDTGLREVIHADGSKSMDLEGRYELATQAHKSADGSVGYSCNDAAHVAQGKHDHTQPAPAAPARDVR